jgi:hypothetical protein
VLYTTEAVQAALQQAAGGSHSGSHTPPPPGYHIAVRFIVLLARLTLPACILLAQAATRGSAM